MIVRESSNAMIWLDRLVGVVGWSIPVEQPHLPDVSGSRDADNNFDQRKLQGGRKPRQLSLCRFLCYDPVMDNNEQSVPDPDTALKMLHGAMGQIQFAREYTMELLEATPRERWFEIPPGLPTNVAWQVGHLTVSQYGLLMFRIRGRQPEDLSLIPGRFRKAYSRQSLPCEDPTVQPSPEELIDRMQEIHTRGMNEIGSVKAEVLLETVDMPYAAYPNKLGAILFCPLHEHIHAGQIGLIRRALGLDPVR